ncbi:hypothetical protein WMY93_021297 [Mugilogobius chulae]|uniref:Uncharacterized protein n=1 Tax=Mugilogobius chulae TaxID=88201 RepID=A0AAW0NA75_9GOBI
MSSTVPPPRHTPGISLLTTTLPQSSTNTLSTVATSSSTPPASSTAETTSSPTTHNTPLTSSSTPMPSTSAVTSRPITHRGPIRSDTTVSPSSSPSTQLAKVIAPVAVLVLIALTAAGSYWLYFRKTRRRSQTETFTRNHIEIPLSEGETLPMHQNGDM